MLFTWLVNSTGVDILYCISFVDVLGCQQEEKVRERERWPQMTQIAFQQQIVCYYIHY